MGIFGWDLPPGCSHRMVEDAMGGNEPCECCGLGIDDCICEECPMCGEYGDPNCYKKHGMKYSREQLDGQMALANMIEVDHMVDDEIYEEWQKDQKSMLDSILDEE